MTFAHRIFSIAATLLMSCVSAGQPLVVHAEPVDALVLEDFRQSSPNPGAAPSRRTVLHLWHDERTLFVAIQANDPLPGGIIARQMRRDVEGMLSEDQVTLVIDTEGAGRNAYLFAVNALGAQFDALIYDGAEMRSDWDAPWTSEARIDAKGWSARLAIPLSVFGQNGSASWRINAERWVPRDGERVRLAGARPDRFVHTLGHAIAIPALRPASGELGLRIKPSVRLISESSAASGTGRSKHHIEPGVELFHESAKGLRTTAALNVDFGEAEADDRTVNLSRFELFQSEKREFFLRDAGRFSFGGLVETAVIPYYSRRIGLDPEGRARALDLGLKLTGSAGGLDFGAFAARVAGGATDLGRPEQPAADVGVLRLARPVGERHRVGLIATRGNPKGTAGSSLWGVDYQFRDTAWFGWRTLEAHAWAMRSVNAAAVSGSSSLNGQAWGGSVKYLNIGPIASFQLQRIDANFDPALGYLAESNVLRGNGTVGWWHRTRSGANLVPALDWSYRRKLDATERTLVLNPELEYTTEAGDSVMAEAFFEEDRLAAGYAPAPGTWIPAGSHRWSYLYSQFETSQARSLWVTGQVRAGGYYNGNRRDVTLTLGFKPGAYWEARVGVGRNVIALPAGSVTVKLATLRLDHATDTSLARSLLLQWDNVSQSLGASARMRWQWAWGREAIFSLDRLGYTDDRRTLAQPQTRLMLKLVWNLER